MKARLENTLVIVLLLAACVTGLAWLHSHFIGYQRTWSDSRQQSCGRLVSLRGRILWQWCELAPFPALPEPILKWPVVMPRDFVVGTNPAGERMTLACGGLVIPFTFPRAVFVGWETRSASSTDGARMTRWSARWREVTISYWVVLVLLVLGPAEVGVRRLYRRTRLGSESTEGDGPARPACSSDHPIG